METVGFDRDKLSKATDRLSEWIVPNNFPGAQPISFMQDHMFQLQTAEYLVLEKSDGIRYLMVETASPAEYFLIDRKYGM